MLKNYYWEDGAEGNGTIGNGNGIETAGGARILGIIQQKESGMNKTMKKKTGKPMARRFQFEATAEMAGGIAKAVDASRRSGLKLTASHVCRLAMAQYLVANGFMSKP